MSEELQRTEQWFKDRCGHLGASQISLALAKTKTGWGASRDNLMANLVVERLTGQPVETYTNAAMLWGVEQESQARSTYQFMKDTEVIETGFVKHPIIEWSGCSPDGLIGEDGLVEIKCPNIATHIEFILNPVIDKKYLMQMAWQMAVTGRQWCDFMSYDPRVPVNLQTKIIRVMRDDSLITELETEAVIFLKEVAEKVERLRKL